MNTKHLKPILIFLFSAMSLIPLLSQADIGIPIRDKLRYDWQSGFVSITELTGGPGIMLTDAPYARYYIGITTVAGYQFSRNIKAGGGTGLHFHNEGVFVPLFLDARFSLNATEYVPYLDAAGGVAFNLSDPGDRTWLFINPSVGVRWVAAERRVVSFSAGLMTMSGNVNRNSYINFKLGIELKAK